MTKLPLLDFLAGQLKQERISYNSLANELGTTVQYVSMQLGGKRWLSIPLADLIVERLDLDVKTLARSYGMDIFWPAYWIPKKKA